MSIITIKRIDKSSTLEQIKIFRESFGITEPIEVTKKYWVLKHYHNPQGDSIIFGAFTDDKLVGINAFMPMQYKLFDETINVVQSCESGVLCSYRRKGIWGKIIKYAMEYFREEGIRKLMIGFPNPGNSYMGFKKLGWSTLWENKNFILINNAKEFSKLYFGEKEFVLARILEFQKTKINCKSSGFSVELVENAVIASDSATVMNIELSEDFINWKVRYKGMQICAIKDGDEVIAYAFFVKESYKCTRIIKLLGVKCVSKYKEKILTITACCLHYICERNSDVAFIRVWATKNNEFYNIYKKLWLISAKHINPFIVYCLNTNAERLKTPEIWRPEFLDLD